MNLIINFNIIIDISTKEVFTLYDYIDYDDLWLSIYPSLFRYIRKHIYSSHVDDLLQEVSLALFLSWKKKPERDKNEFIRIAFGITKNQIALFYRKQKKDMLIVQATKDNWISQSDLYINHSLSNLLHGEIFIEIFSFLTVKEQELIFFRYIMDLSFSQIAFITGRRPSALMAMHVRVKQRLHNILSAMQSLK